VTLLRVAKKAFAPTNGPNATRWRGEPMIKKTPKNKNKENKET
jgi:hypothetical protein